MAMSGGSVAPVAQGLASRISQPLGAMTKARPIAIAACGAARKGASHPAPPPRKRPSKTADVGGDMTMSGIPIRRNQ